MLSLIHRDRGGEFPNICTNVYNDIVLLDTNSLTRVFLFHLMENIAFAGLEHVPIFFLLLAVSK